MVRIENVDRTIGQIGRETLVAQHLASDLNIGAGAGNNSVEFGFGQEVGQHAGGAAGAQKHMMAFGPRLPDGGDMSFGHDAVVGIGAIHVKKNDHVLPRR